MKPVFYTLAQNISDCKKIEFFIVSLRAFGGKFQAAPVWIFHPQNIRVKISNKENIILIPLEIKTAFQRIWFSAKVFAAAQAEILAIKKNIDNLIWFGSSGFIIQSPDQFNLRNDFDVAFRPVHHKNIGIQFDKKPDDFWREIYDFIGLEDSNKFIETFVENEKIKPYFNSHLFSIIPQKKILQKWKNAFVRFHKNELSHKPAFSDQLHQIFIHQALLSAILAKNLDWDRIDILSEKYSYPLHLHHQVPHKKQPNTLNDLVCPVYEDVFQFPETLNGLKVNEPLKKWLKERMKNG